MISKETIYKAFAVWFLTLIFLLVFSLPVAFLLPSMFQYYGLFLFLFGIIPLCIFFDLSQRPDVVIDLIDDEPQ